MILFEGTARNVKPAGRRFCSGETPVSHSTVQCTVSDRTLYPTVYRTLYSRGVYRVQRILYSLLSLCIIALTLRSEAQQTPVTAIDIHPDAGTLATAGFEKIHFYNKGKAPISSPDFEPVASEDLLSRWTFDDDSDFPITEGVAGKAFLTARHELIDSNLTESTIHQAEAFTFMSWVRPDGNGGVLYGTNPFQIGLRTDKAGWKSDFSFRN